MKFGLSNTLYPIRPSHPARGAWIEIPWEEDDRLKLMSHPARGAWIEIRDKLSVH